MRTMTLGLVGILAISASATTIVSEDFESYADTAALGGVWSLGDGTLDTVVGNGGNSMAHPGTGGSFTGANTNSISFAPVMPAAGEVLVYSADIYDDASSANKRVTAGLRTAAGANLIEMGMYNGPTHYAVRTILFASGGSNWVAFDNIVDDLGQPISNAPVEGWHTFTVEITDSQATFMLDLNGDGNINATRVEAITASAGYDIIRLGGPSDLSSAGGGANFDNISLELVPEPSALVLLCLGGAALARRR